MQQRPRLIPILLLDRDRRLVKTVRFGDRTYIGDPFNVVRLFNEKEVDELCILDIDATRDRRTPDLGFVTELVSECFMPVAFGGGLSDVRTCEALNRTGVEKLVFGTAAARDPSLLAEVAANLGAQAVIGSVDAHRGQVTVKSATETVMRTPVDHARALEAAGAGEILLQSVERDGARRGLDLELVAAVARAVKIPVVAGGGAGTITHLAEAIAAGASAAASGSTFTFIGRLRAVLVTYPTPAEIAAALR